MLLFRIKSANLTRTALLQQTNKQRMMRNRPRELFDALGTAIALHLELLKAEVRGEVPWSDVKWARRHVERIRAEMEWERAKVRERSGKA